jgi:hypothetical protein
MNRNRGASTPEEELEIAAGFAQALDADDFETLLPMLAIDVVYRVGEAEHHGPAAVAGSYRAGSELARRLFDVVTFSHQIVGVVGGRTVRIDFVDTLRVGDEELEHHSVQDVRIDEAGRIATITDVPLDGERERVDAFLKRHGLTRDEPPTGT